MRSRCPDAASLRLLEEESRWPQISVTSKPPCYSYFCSIDFSSRSVALLNIDLLQNEVHFLSTLGLAMRIVMSSPYHPIDRFSDEPRWLHRKWLFQQPELDSFIQASIRSTLRASGITMLTNASSPTSPNAASPSLQVPSSPTGFALDAVVNHDLPAMNGTQLYLTALQAIFYLC